MLRKKFYIYGFFFSLLSWTLDVRGSSAVDFVNLSAESACGLALEGKAPGALLNPTGLKRLDGTREIALYADFSQSRLASPTQPTLTIHAQAQVVQSSSPEVESILRAIESEGGRILILGAVNLQPTF